MQVHQGRGCWLCLQYYSVLCMTILLGERLYIGHLSGLRLTLLVYCDPVLRELMATSWYRTESVLKRYSQDLLIKETHGRYYAKIEHIAWPNSSLDKQAII